MAKTMNKDRILGVRVSDKDIKVLKKLSKKSGKTMSELVRESVKTLDDDYINENKRLREALNKIQKEIEEST